ncbi:acetoacetate metabolism regulatory protein AtoC [Waddlia chondrophila 2032/99]|uniref:Sigma-54 dependent response regulator atoC n=2 Tax=Waddlia chondrophila TaxID=71667 RepID=D6YS75_WADCW|nr:sigma-54 dependent transcriptional regulator [Waddlia chondrophila]ADI38920.1 sigma-54 dependent response regulator atoC [Waddlia chondrophila WSU 86-1044]CCB92038.1 acetoacetate metabolism regulatory protein AtoC [Waddlia chondrophila 2032/99]
MSIEKILVIDDEEIIRTFIAETLSREGFEVSTAENGKKGIGQFKDCSYDLVFTDMKMPDLTGIEVLTKIKEVSPQTPVVVITAYGSIENAVEAMRYGAFNYLIKPFSPDTIEAVVEKAKEHQSLITENQYLREEVYNKRADTKQGVIAENTEMQQILKDVARIAKSNASVFITGESGTGKEVIAQAIHDQSLRHSRPFIKVNCAAVPEALIESEFFGHEKGAFTGANQKRIGRFELANGGTLLLDEVTEIPLTVQAKLLRAIQEQIFERVGGSKPIKVDVRIIATSNRDIKQAIDNHVLREDLYYRLNVVPIHLPPLKHRSDDILPLAEYFLTRMSKENHKKVKKLTSAAKQKLLSYHWPGNVRELANIIERAVVMENKNEISPEYIFLEPTGDLPAKHQADLEASEEKGLPVGLSLRELEKQLIIETLLAHNNNKKKTAEILGISPRTLRNKLNEYKNGS